MNGLCKSISWAAAAFAIGLAPATAADKAGGGNPVWSDAPGFNELDKDGDGALSRAEAAGNAWLAKNFKEADSDGDGKLTRTEYLKRMAAKDFNSLREGAAELIKPGDQSSSGNTAK